MNMARSQFKCGFIHFLGFVVISSTLFAVPVGKNQAQKAVRGWLRQNASPMGRSISDIPVETGELLNENGQILCHIINLTPEGFVIASVDDEIEPIIAFSSTGYYDGDENSPLTTMLKKDMAGRLAVIGHKNRDVVRSRKKRHKWQTLLNVDEPKAGTELEMGTESITSVSEVWVDPFVQSLWDQYDVGDGPCYNTYTPNNYPTGCVATAMAQVMRYYTYPTTGIGVHGFTIKVDGVSQTWSTRGGDGSGGDYNWSLMPYDPLSGVTDPEREMIGSLCYDAGVSVGMSYHDIYSGGSSASLGNADTQFGNTFFYSNSIYTQTFSPGGQDHMWDFMNANLDARIPVILGISRTGGGHAVVADGYGYNGGTLYHHINMGWGGSDNAWYQLPTIDAYYTYTVVDDAVYNIYPDGSGEIISGRVTNLAGAPLAGVTVRAYIGSSLQKQAVTDSRGVYALTNLNSGTTYRISPIKTGETFVDQDVTTGTSSDWGTPGNKSRILFVSADEGPPIAYDIEADVDSTESVIIQLQALDDGIPDPNLLQYIITSLPAHGQLNEPNVGPIDAVPYAMSANDANGVMYTPCPYFGGQDTFTYKANDGGTYPTGGDSNIANVTVNVNNQIETTFAPSSNLIGGWPIEASKHDSRVDIIYLASDVGQARNITGIALSIQSVPGQTLNNWTIRMKHTTKNDFSTTNYFENSDWINVYQSNETISSVGWWWFNFDTPFAYNGSQNIMVDFTFNNSYATSDGACFVSNVGTGRAIMSYSNSTMGDPLTWTTIQYGSSGIPNCKFVGVAPVEPLVGDFDATCDVRLPDMAIFAQAWQTASGDANYNEDCDLTTVKGTIDLQDLRILSENWLQTYP